MVASPGRRGWGGEIALAGRFGVALSQIAIDRVLEPFGHSLPRTPGQLADARIVNRLVEARAPGADAGLPPLKTVRLSGVDFESSNCRNFLLDLEFEDERPDNPRTAYAKLPCRELMTRAFANAVGFWETEVAFCEGIASRMPIRVPRVYAVARQGARFVLLLENLHELDGAKLFDNRDMAAGTTVERARSCLETFARLHAGFEGLTTAEQEALLPRRLHTYLALGGRARTRALNALSIRPAHRAAPDLFEASHVEMADEAIEKWDALIEHWYSGPLTLIHGDSHLANCFEYTGAGGPAMGMLDFQGIQWGKGIRDVQYFLINSLEPDTLARHEDALIEGYVDALATHGVSLPLDVAKDQYRALSFQTLMVAVVAMGLGSLTERDETVRTVLRRSVAAVERLDFRGWLERI